MKACPLCQYAPRWHFARNVSEREKRDHWMFAPCEHGADLQKNLGFVPTCDKPEVERSWEARCEDLFKRQSERWTEAERAAFRALIWPPPPTDPIPREWRDAAAAAREEPEPPF